MEDYQDFRPIGKGSYGEVFYVRSKSDNKEYVIKKIKLRGASEKERRAAQQEAGLLSQLKHPNIVSYKESFQHNGLLHIVMGYCEGGDLRCHLKSRGSKHLTESQIIHWFVQISLALQYLHDRHILHRDLKTQNIFLSRNILKVGDLGIARVLDSPSAMACTIIGTPYYMSPEIFKNKPYNHKSDVWALGCCVVEMATLNTAFSAKDLNSLAFKIISGKLPTIHGCYSQDLRNMIKCTLARDPDQRPTIGQLLRLSFIKTHIKNFLQQRLQSKATTPQEKKSTTQHTPKTLSSSDEVDICNFKSPDSDKRTCSLEKVTSIDSNAISNNNNDDNNNNKENNACEKTLIQQSPSLLTKFNTPLLPPLPNIPRATTNTNTNTITNNNINNNNNNSNNNNNNTNNNNNNENTSNTNHDEKVILQQSPSTKVKSFDSHIPSNTEIQDETINKQKDTIQSNDNEYQTTVENKNDVTTKETKPDHSLARHKSRSASYIDIPRISKSPSRTKARHNMEVITKVGSIAYPTNKNMSPSNSQSPLKTRSASALDLLPSDAQFHRNQKKSASSSSLPSSLRSPKKSSKPPEIPRSIRSALVLDIKNIEKDNINYEKEVLSPTKPPIPTSNEHKTSDMFRKLSRPLPLLPRSPKVGGVVKRTDNINSSNLRQKFEFESKPIITPSEHPSSPYLDIGLDSPHESRAVTAISDKPTISSARIKRRQQKRDQRSQLISQIPIKTSSSQDEEMPEMNAIPFIPQMAESPKLSESIGMGAHQNESLIRDVPNNKLSSDEEKLMTLLTSTLKLDIEAPLVPPSTGPVFNVFPTEESFNSMAITDEESPTCLLNEHLEIIRIECIEGLGESLFKRVLTLYDQFAEGQIDEVEVHLKLMLGKDKFSEYGSRLRQLKFCQNIKPNSIQ